MAALKDLANVPTDLGILDSSALIADLRKITGAMRPGRCDDHLIASWRGTGCHVTLWVLPENERALTFYAGHGFEVETGVEKREERSGRAVIRMRTEL